MSAAARLLDTNPATVSRRLARLSETLGFDLFLKTPQGWTSNEAVGELIETITTFENEISSYLNARDSLDEEVSGHVNVGCSPSIINYVLFPGLNEFLTKNSNLSLSFTNNFYQDALGDSDMFISAVRPQQGRLVVRFIGKYATNVYCYPDSPRSGQWIGLQPMHDRYPPQQHARTIMGGRDPSVRLETLMDTTNAVRTTRFPGIMPVVAAKTDPELVLYDSDSRPLHTPLYLCFHETRRKDPLLQLVADWITERFSTSENV